MERIEEFVRDGKNFVYIDVSGIKSNGELSALFARIKSVIVKYRENPVYTITNVANIRYDSETKQMTKEYLEHNKPYVKSGAIIGLDGVKKIMAVKLTKLSGRKNMLVAFTKEKAIELLLRQDS